MKEDLRWTGMACFLYLIANVLREIDGANLSINIYKNSFTVRNAVMNPMVMADLLEKTKTYYSI